jgi:hypothetical protein
MSTYGQGAPPPPWDQGPTYPPGPPPGQQWNQPGAWTQYPAGPPQQPGVAINNYRGQAIALIVASVLFGLLGLATSIPALVASSRVNENLARGDYPAAAAASRRARTLCWVSLAIVIGILLLIIIASASSGGSGSNS